MRCPRCKNDMQLMNAGFLLGMAMTNFYCADCNHNETGGDILQMLTEKPLFAVSQINEEGMAA